MIQSLSEQFGTDLLVLSSPGVASLIAFRNKVIGLRKLVPTEDDDNVAVTKVAKKLSVKQYQKCQEQDATRRHQLTLHMQLPPQKVVLTVTENKVQLMDLAC